MEIYFANNRTQKFHENLERDFRIGLKDSFAFLQQHSYLLGMPHSKALGGGLFELRVINSIHVRFIYTFYEGDIWILHGFIKKSNRIQKQDIEYARMELKKLLR